MPFKGTYKIHIDSTNNYTSSNSSYLEIYSGDTALYKFQLTSYQNGKSNLTFIYNILNIITFYSVCSPIFFKLIFPCLSISRTFTTTLSPTDKTSSIFSTLSFDFLEL